MIKTLQNTLKQDKEGFVLPKSVQDAIPIRRLWPDGIFQFGSKFSKTIRFTDINYAIASKEDKTSMFLGCSELLNALDMGSTTKITINNKRFNRHNFEQEILIPRRDDYLDGCRAELARLLNISDNQLSYITNVDSGRGAHQVRQHHRSVYECLPEKYPAVQIDVHQIYGADRCNLISQERAAEAALFLVREVSVNRQNQREEARQKGPEGAGCVRSQAVPAPWAG